jgi:hypothetical protein
MESDRMRLVPTSIIAVFIALCTIFSGQAVWAQVENRLTTVQNRPRPGTDAVGIRSGGFMILPTISVSETYDDNVLASESSTRDDLITDIVPAIIVESDWTRHSLAVHASADLGFHASYSDENFQDYQVGARGRLDVLRDTYLSGSIGYQALHESRASADDAGGDEPGEYSLATSEIGIFNRFNRVALSADARLQRYDYDDVVVSGAVSNQDDRDRDRIDVTLRGGYEIVPEYQAFLRVNFNDTSYEDGTDDLGFKRGSDGYEMVAGVKLDLSGVTFGNIFAGYISHDYIDSRLATIDGATFGADLTWNATELTTVKAVLARTISETTQSSTSGTFDTNFDITADHELLRQLILSARAGFGFADFEGISREDKFVRFGVGAKYLMNRNLDIRLDYDFGRRNSDAADSDYTKNVIMLRAVGKL